MHYILNHSQSASPIRTENGSPQITMDNPPYEFRKVAEQVFGNWHGHSWNITDIVYCEFKIGDLRFRGNLFYIHNILGGWAIQYNNKKGMMEYFLFGCHHSQKELTKEECNKRGITHFGNMYHVYECTKCGHIQSVSSD